MKSKLLCAVSILLCLVIPVSTLIIPSGAAVSTLDPSIALAYAKVLQYVINEYGICTASVDSDGFVERQGYTNFEDDQLGLAYAELIDFDGSGTPELYLYYAHHDYDSSIDELLQYKVTEEIWHWNGSTAAKAYSNDYAGVIHGGTFLESHSIYKSNGKTYLAYSSLSARSGMAWVIQYIEQFSNGGLTNYQTITEAWDANWEVGGILYSLTINGEQIYDNVPTDYFPIESDGWASAEAQNFYQQYDLSGSEELIRIAAWSTPIFKCNSPSSLLNRLLTKAAESTSGTNSVIEMAYIGDFSRCQMDARMVNTYADILESLSTPPYGETWSAALVDVSGDGYPLMLTVCGHYSPAIGGYYCSDYSIWEYRNGRAAAYDFSKDSAGYDHEPRTFGIYSIKEGRVLYGNVTDGGATGIVGGTLYYQVSGATITLIHSVMTNYETGRTTLDGKNSSDPDQELGVNYDNLIFLVATGSVGPLLGTDTMYADTFASALRSYAKGLPEVSHVTYTAFPEVTEENDPNIPGLTEFLTTKTGGEVDRVYKLNDEYNIYYAIITIDKSEQGALVQGIREAVTGGDTKDAAESQGLSKAADTQGQQGKAAVDLSNVTQLSGQADHSLVWKLLQQDETPLDENDLKAVLENLIETLRAQQKPEPTDAPESTLTPTEEPGAPQKTGGGLSPVAAVIVVLIIIAAGGGAAWFILIKRKKKQ